MTLAELQAATASGLEELRRLQTSAVIAQLELERHRIGDAPDPELPPADDARLADVIALVQTLVQATALVEEVGEELITTLKGRHRWAEVPFVPVPEPEPAHEPVAEDAPPPRRGWLARLRRLR